MKDTNPIVWVLLGLVLAWLIFAYLVLSQCSIKNGLRCVVWKRGYVNMKFEMMAFT